MCRPGGRFHVWALLLELWEHRLAGNRYVGGQRALWPGGGVQARGGHSRAGCRSRRSTWRGLCRGSGGAGPEVRELVLGGTGPHRSPHPHRARPHLLPQPLVWCSSVVTRRAQSRLWGNFLEGSGDRGPRCRAGPSVLCSGDTAVCAPGRPAGGRCRGLQPGNTCVERVLTSRGRWALAPSTWVGRPVRGAARSLSGRSRERPWRGEPPFGAHGLLAAHRGFGRARRGQQ